MLARLALCALFALSICPTALDAAAPRDAYEERLAATDADNADQLYLLGKWCSENGYVFKSKRHYSQALKVDPDHQATRDAMGYVWYDDEWVHKSRVPGGLAPKEQEEARVQARRGAPGRPGPAAGEIDWDLTIPPFAAEGHAAWLGKMTAQMNRSDNYSGEMDSAWRTLMMPQYIESAVPAMATALMDPGFKDLYGAVMLGSELRKTGEGANLARARALLPFVVKASERVSDSEELYFFGLFAGAVGDKRAVPRLIELLGKGGDAADGAKAGISMITMIPEDEVTAELAQEWWNRWHQSDDGEIFGAQLEDANPMVRIKAAERLYPEQDPRIVPTLIEVLKRHDGPTKHAAIRLLTRITGNDWDLSGNLPPDEQRARVQRLADWWDENKHTFTFLEFRGQMTTGGDGGREPKRDSRQVWIRQLSSMDPEEERSAYDGLLRAGEAAVEPLIDALESEDGIRRGKARDLLRTITRQNFGYEPIQGSEDERREAIARWRAWAAEQVEQAPAEGE